MTEPNPTTPRRSGSWAVIAMVVLGLVAAVIAYIYWTNYVKVGEPEPRTRAAEFDYERAAKELAQLDDDLAEAKRVQRFDAILDRVHAFVARYPKFPPAYTLLAKVYIERLEWPRAYEELQRSLALAAEQPLVHRLAGTMQYEMGDYEKAEEHYHTAHLLDPNDPIHVVYIAQVYLRTNRIEEAKIKLLEALQMNPRTHEAYATMSDLYMKQNDPTRALQQIDRALEVTQAIANERGVVVPYVRKRGAVLRRAEQPEAALQTFEQMLHEAEMFQPVVAREVAETWGQMGRPDEAVKFYDRATAANPTEWRLLEGATDWALRAGDVRAARRHLRSLEKLNPHLPVIAQLRRRVEVMETQVAVPQE